MSDVNVPELFGSAVFNEKEMKARLPKETYRAVKNTIRLGRELDLGVANVVAAAMKEWATEHGATHFTHWFQPMTGITAEKHEAFISPQNDGTVVMEFSGKELTRGEPDASSFPSGGLRATFEARGYTTWDTSACAFIKDGTLCIPTAFCSYSGEALDKKTPLLRSAETLNKYALDILNMLGEGGVSRVYATVGPEQEYFLVDKEMFDKRPDLKYCGRTLFGARPSRGQELEDHYYGAINRRVSEFMKELDRELWRLGISAKTEHNEVAPSQHELAPVFTNVVVATDHNQLTMELMKVVARRHGLECLLHEKPFAGVNGSGKHNNWSLSTDTGLNLLEPGDKPYENTRFLLFLTAVIKAVNEYGDMLRMSVATAGNDHRLGANEAPPAIVSIFLGDELKAVLDAIKDGATYEDVSRGVMTLGSKALAEFPKDNTDRNRTSPFAFTGNKFEFRMLGSSISIAGSNYVLNTAVADVLRLFAEELKGKFAPDDADAKRAAILALVKKHVTDNYRILFNGDNYSSEWVAEAERRGLPNAKSTPDALKCFVDPKNVALMSRHHVLTETEVKSRHEILLENYAKALNIEALTMLDMAKREIIPAALDYQNEIVKLFERKHNLALPHKDEERVISVLSNATSGVIRNVAALETAVTDASAADDSEKRAELYRERVFAAMNELRITVDCLETEMPKSYWPYPSYGELMYSM